MIIRSSFALAVIVSLAVGCGSSGSSDNRHPGDEGADAGGTNQGGNGGQGGDGTNTGGAGKAGTGGTSGASGASGASGNGGVGGNGSAGHDAQDAGLDASAQDAGDDASAQDAGLDASDDLDAAADGGGESEACKALACAAPKVCDESGAVAVCACPAGYSDVSGTCKADDGTECSDNGDCLNAHCVSEVCCASACTTPPLCQLAAGATCGDGTTCVYAHETEGTSCDDSSVCTHDDACHGGACTGTAVSCDDDNPCTVDACDASTGCSNDGTGVTKSCASDDNCNTGYVCQGDDLGSCLPTTSVDCSNVSDDCNVGFCDTANGQCKKSPLSGVSCNDGNKCTSGETCTAGSCGGGTASVCNDQNPCTDDSCDPSVGCVTLNNTVSCDDGNPCTTNDKCAGGACQQSIPRNCADSNLCTDDACDSTKLAGDPCTHTNNTAPCSDGSSCTSSDTCSAGACVGGGNACGSNANSCTPGMPNTCTCMAGFVDGGAGSCVPVVNECALNPCHANADCVDPSSAINDFVCTCKTGYTGDGAKTGGTGCADIDECAGNPCGAGRGTCTQGVPGTYSCACASGFQQVGGTCVCDLNGTFAIKITETLSWSGIANIEDATGADRPVVSSWALRHHTYDANGKLQVVTTPCGGETIDLCGTANFPGLITPEAYTQFLPVQIWGTSAMPSESLDMQLPNALPGASFVSQPTAALLGISLTDPLGAWPATRAQIGVSASQINGAVWIDHDADTKSGVTTYAVGPGGFPVDGIAPDPIAAYPATSAACPRTNDAAARLAYNYFPAFESFTVRRVKRFYVGSRSIGYFDGSLTSCNLIQGTVKGPSNGQIQNDGRVQGCVRVSGTGETDCSDGIVDFFDTADQTAQKVDGATFIIKRLANDATCADARAAVYP